MRVHERDDWRVDGILRLIEKAAKPGPLTEVLEVMCRQVSVIAHADVVSVYVRESDRDGEWLVLRANVGFPDSAVGSVRLAMGEGITGTAAEVMRPISTSVAEKDSHYKHVPELGEERYPSFLAVPLMVRGAVAGVLVLQRSEATSFSSAEVALSTALATTFAHALDSAAKSRNLVPRSARLVGVPLSGGEALGRVTMMGTLEALDEPTLQGSDPVRSAGEALDAVAGIVRKACRRVEEELSKTHQQELRSYALLLDDQRLRDTIEEKCAELGIAYGLKQVAREYAVASYATGEAHPLLEERAAEAENLCLLIAALACDLPLPAAGSVLVVAERLSTFTALAVAGCRGAAILSGGRPEPDSLSVAIARAAKIPLVGGVAGLFAWVRPDDTVLVNGDTGVLRVNPPATRIARFRQGQR